MQTAVILAGGQARRFNGRNKPLLPVGGTSIISRQLKILTSITDSVAIVTNDVHSYSRLEVTIWKDLIPNIGPLGGIYTALNNSLTDRTLIIAGDMPFLTQEFLQYVVDIQEDVDIVIPHTTDGYQPLCASYRNNCRNLLKQRIDEGNLKLVDLLSDCRVYEIKSEEIQSVNSNRTLFFNINTPEDYRQANILASQ